MIILGGGRGNYDLVVATIIECPSFEHMSITELGIHFELTLVKATSMRDGPNWEKW